MKLRNKKKRKKGEKIEVSKSEAVEGRLVTDKEEGKEESDEGWVESTEKERGRDKEVEEEEEDIPIGWGWMDIEGPWSKERVRMKLPIEEINRRRERERGQRRL